MGWEDNLTRVLKCPLLHRDQCKEQPYENKWGIRKLNKQTKEKQQSGTQKTPTMTQKQLADFWNLKARSCLFLGQQDKHCTSCCWSQEESHFGYGRYWFCWSLQSWRWRAQREARPWEGQLGHPDVTHPLPMPAALGSSFPIQSSNGKYI